LAKEEEGIRGENSKEEIGATFILKKGRGSYERKKL